MEENEALSQTEEKINQKSLSDISLHKDVALQKLNTLLTNYLNNPSTQLKADKLSYWLEDYCSLLSFEDNFKPNYLKSYSRGDVIKVNLGYNIGNEEGGLHYCIFILAFKIKLITLC